MKLIKIFTTILFAILCLSFSACTHNCLNKPNLSSGLNAATDFPAPDLLIESAKQDGDFIIIKGRITNNTNQLLKIPFFGHSVEENVWVLNDDPFGEIFQQINSNWVKLSPPSTCITYLYDLNPSQTILFKIKVRIMMPVTKGVRLRYNMYSLKSSEFNLDI